MSNRLGNEFLREIAVQTAARIVNTVEGQTYFSEPFRHIVLDDFLPQQLALDCLNAYPPLDDGSWEFACDRDIEVKYRTNWKSEFDIPDDILPVVRLLNSALFLNAVSTRIGIPKLMPDPYFTGGGLNVTTFGGLLDVHVDGNYHDASGLNRRLNAILYLTQDWQPDWGGEFGLYDSTGQYCIKKIDPLFNRLIIFDSHDHSFHGLPDPVRFPEHSPRRSLILYYYTRDARPSHQVSVSEPHSALWVKRNLLDKRGNKTRDFK